MELDATMRTKAKIAILMLSAVCGVTSVLVILLADIAKAFPDASQTAVQNVYSVMSFAITVFCLLVGVLARKFRKKVLLVIGIAIMIAGGLLPLVLHDALIWMYISAFFVGVGAGMYAPLLIGCIMEYFTGNEQNTVMGLYSALATLGASAFTMLGGIICDNANWVAAHYLYIFVVVGLLGVIFFLPMDPKPQQGAASTTTDSAEKVSMLTKRSLLIIVDRFLLMFVYAAHAVSISMFVTGTGIGETTQASLAAALVMLASAGISVVCAPILGVLKMHTVTLSSVAFIAGVFITALAQNMPMVIVGAVLVGVALGLVNASQAVYVGAVCDSPLQFTFTVSVLTSVGTLAIMACPTILNTITALWTEDSLRGAFYTATAISVGVFAFTIAVNTFLTKRAAKQSTTVPE